VTRVSFKGFIIGGIVDMAATFVAAFPVGIYAFAVSGAGKLPQAQQAQALADAMRNTPSLYIAGLLVGALCSVLGGYVAARVARHDELLNGALSSFLCVATGLYALARGTEGTAPWVHVLLLVISPLLGALGAYLRLRGKNLTAGATPTPA
jgi:hypothetical protein